MTAYSLTPYLKSINCNIKLETSTEQIPMQFNYKTVFDFCNDELLRHDITSEMRKYLIGKKYKSFYMINNQNSINSQDTAKYIGKEYGISSALIIKYDLYSRAIDVVYDKNPVFAVNILRSKEKIPLEYVIKLSKMENEDIKYLKFLLGKNFYRAAGYTPMQTECFIPDKSNSDSDIALIKQMPAKDYDSMVTSLIYTIPSWINFITKTMSESDMSRVSAVSCCNLEKKLYDLKNTVNKILIEIEANNNE